VKLKARVWAADDKGIAPGAMTETARDIPITVGFDSRNVVGRATVFPDGTAELEIDVPMERRSLTTEDGVLGIGYVVEQDRWEGDVRIIERLRPLTVGVGQNMIDQIMRGTK
jgi:hypothetical protein